MSPLPSEPAPRVLAPPRIPFFTSTASQRQGRIAYGFRLVLFCLILLLGMFQAKRVMADIVSEHQKLMVQAVQHGNMNQMTKLLATPYIDINDEVPPYRTTYLLFALEAHNLTSVRFLIDNGAELLWRVKSVYGYRTPGSTYLILVTCPHGRREAAIGGAFFDVFFEAIKNHFEPEGPSALKEFLDTTNQTSYTALTCLEEGDHDLNAWSADEDSLLHMAVPLIQNGADPNIRIGLGHMIDKVKQHTPTYHRLIDFLVKSGAN